MMMSYYCYNKIIVMYRVEVFNHLELEEDEELLLLKKILIELTQYSIF